VEFEKKKRARRSKGENGTVGKTRAKRRRALRRKNRKVKKTKLTTRGVNKEKKACKIRSSGNPLSGNSGPPAEEEHREMSL